MSSIYKIRKATRINNSTSTTTKTNGALIVDGGISSGNNIVLGGYLGITGTNNNVISLTANTSTGAYNFNLPTTSGSSLDVLTSAGGGSSPMTWSTCTGTSYIVRSNGPTFGASTVTFGGPVSGITTLSTSGLITASGGLTSTGTTTLGTTNISNANLTVLGSISISPTSGLTLLVSSTTSSSTTNLSNSICTLGGIGVTGDSIFSGIINFNNATASTSSTTGALLVSGGVGISGNINVGFTASGQSSSFLYPTMANGNNVGIWLGKAISTKNAVRLVYLHSGDGSNSNYFSLDFNGQSNVITGSAAGNVGIGTSTPASRLTINQIDNNLTNSFDHSISPLTVTQLTPTSHVVLNDQLPVLHLTRAGTITLASSARATFALSRYEHSSTNSRSRLDIQLAQNVYDTVNVMSIRGDGNVGIGTTTPVSRLHLASNASLFDSLLTISESTHISSRRAGIQLGGWIVGQDLGSSGLKDFFFYDNNTANTRFYIGIGGNIGIGTGSPSAQLNVNNDFTISANSASWNSTAGKGIFMRYSTFDTNDGAYIQSVTRSSGTFHPLLIYASDLSFVTNDITRLFISQAGVVTITSTTASTSSITGALVVSGGVGISGLINQNYTAVLSGNITLASFLRTGTIGTPSISIKVGVSDTAKNCASIDFGYLGSNLDTSYLRLGLQGQTGMQIFGNNNVSITSTTASTTTTTGALVVAGGVGIAGTLTVGGTANVIGASASLTVGTSGGTGGAIYFGNSSHGITRDAGNNIIINTTSANVVLQTNGTTRVYATSGGRFISEAINIQFSGSGTADQIQVYANGSNPSNGYFFYNASNVYGTGSDRRIKKNINNIPLNISEDFIKKLNPVTFELKNCLDNSKQCGFIAQEILSVCINDEQKSCVNKWETYDENDPNCPIMGVSDKAIVSNLVGALKSAFLKIEALEQRISLLEI